MTDITSVSQSLVRIPLSVRWRDMDSFGHVNNAMYVSYLEEARCRWLSQLAPGALSDRVVPVLVNTNINYCRPIVWPSDVLVELFIQRAGKSSLTVGHRILDAKDEGVLYSDGQVTLVWMDIRSGQSVPLPDAIRALQPE